MRLSREGCVENILSGSVIINAVICPFFCVSSLIFSVIIFSRLSPAIIFVLLVYCAHPRSARYSRIREKYMTTKEARNPSPI